MPIFLNLLYAAAHSIFNSPNKNFLTEEIKSEVTYVKLFLLLLDRKKDEDVRSGGKIKCGNEIMREKFSPSVFISLQFLKNFMKIIL